MYRLCFVLTLCIYGAFARIVDFDEWQYDAIGPPSVNNGGGNSECKKDLVLVVDTSRSIGHDFNKNVRPFLKNLVKEPSLNVGPDGTHIALIIFSKPEKTETILELGAEQNADELEKIIDGLNWGKIQGGHTRTDLGLDLAKKILQRNSPLNHRPEIDDVVVLITDGEPRGRKTTPDDTKQSAQDLKDRDVLLVTAGVGEQSEEKEFKDMLKSLATSPDYFVKAAFDKMGDILDTLIAKSCTKPGNCYCLKKDTVTLDMEATSAKTEVSWPKPQFSCTTGGDASIEKTEVVPAWSSPRNFYPGNYVITYTYTLNGGVTVACPVNINIAGEVCGDKVFNRDREECCCGTVHPRKSNHECCGPKYYARSQMVCCTNDHLISKDETCP